MNPILSVFLKDFLIVPDEVVDGLYAGAEVAICFCWLLLSLKNNAALAVDNIDMANGRKIPLWAFGCLY